jgi:hypothetical protein
MRTDETIRGVRDLRPGKSLVRGVLWGCQILTDTSSTKCGTR